MQFTYNISMQFCLKCKWHRPFLGVNKVQILVNFDSDELTSLSFTIVYQLEYGQV